MLDRFGFTPTESKTYQALLKLGPSTGYAVARELGIARANVYQALEALVRRRAARKGASSPSQYAAVTPSALTAELERDFHRDLESLNESLRRLPVGESARGADPLVLESRVALLEAAVGIVRGATSEVLAVCGPWALALDEALEEASARGVSTKAVGLGRPAPSMAVVRAVPESELRAYWGGLPLAVVADRARVAFGLITTGDAASGLVTASAGAVPFLRHLLRRELASAG